METKPTTYTEEFVKEQTGKILDLILSDKDIVYIGEVFENLPYSRQRYSEWETNFKNCQEITDTMKRIKEILESRVNTGALKNKLNSNMAKFNLINNYDWKDKTETDNKTEHSGEIKTIFQWKGSSQSTTSQGNGVTDSTTPPVAGM